MVVFNIMVLMILLVIFYVQLLVIILVERCFDVFYYYFYVVYFFVLFKEYFFWLFKEGNIFGFNVVMVVIRYIGLFFLDVGLVKVIYLEEVIRQCYLFIIIKDGFLI